MKELTITGMDGIILSKTIVNVEGDNFNLALTIPTFLPIINFSLLEVEKKENKRIKGIMERVKAMVS